MVDWDILQLDDDEDNWVHMQILHRLWDKDVECLFADIWDDDLAFLVGCNAPDARIASALGVNPRSIYNDFQHSFVIVNLVEEKMHRGWPIEKILDDNNDD